MNPLLCQFNSFIKHNRKTCFCFSVTTVHNMFFQVRQYKSKKAKKKQNKPKQFINPYKPSRPLRRALLWIIFKSLCDRSRPAFKNSLSLSMYTSDADITQDLKQTRKTHEGLITFYKSTLCPGKTLCLKWYELSPLCADKMIIWMLLMCTGVGDG